MLLTRSMISYGYSCSKKKQRKSLSPQALKTSLKSLLTSFAWPMDTPSPFVWDLDKAVRRVHASNISKLDETGKPVLRDEGKVLKGDQYKEPDLSDLVEPT